MKDKFLRALNAVGKPPELLSGPDGTAIVVLPHGGRVLGLFAPGSDENFLWTHPALEAVSSARAFFASEDWHNSGGDRTWLAPEADFFLPRFPDASLYHQPRQLDPGAYTCERCGSAIKLENRLTLRSSRTRQDVELRLTRCVEPAANPLRKLVVRASARIPAGPGHLGSTVPSYGGGPSARLRHRRTGRPSVPSPQGRGGKAGPEPLAEPLAISGCHSQGPYSHLEFAGYTLRSSLEILGGNAPNGVGLWSLLQLPHGGEMLIPTWTRAEPKVYFGEIPPDALRVEDRLVRYAMRAEGEQKIGVRALAATGRAGYLRREGRARTLVVRSFAVNPSGAYVDVPWDDPADIGYAVQACNVNSKWGAFSELEYHVPAIGGDTGLTRCGDASQVWAFRGGPEPIHTLARLLLGAWLRTRNP